MSPQVVENDADDSTETTTADYGRLEQLLDRLMQMMDDAEEMEPSELSALLQQLDTLTDALNQLSIEKPKIDDNAPTSATGSESLSPSHLAYLDSYRENLTHCRPAIYENLVSPGLTESIRGWVGDTCLVDQQLISNGVQVNSRCFYSRQDIALLTADEPRTIEARSQQCRPR